MDALGAAEDTANYKDYYGAQPPSAQGYYDTSGGAPPQAGGPDLGSQVADNGGFAMEHGDGEGDDDDDDETPRRSSAADSTKAGRRKIKIEFIQDKSRRHITFSKRKAGIMKKAYELSTLTGTQVLLLVVSETGLVYTFTTAKLQPLVTQPEGKNLIQACLNAPTGGGSNGGPSSGPSGPGGPPGSGAAGGSSGRQGGGGRNNVGGINIGGGAGGGDVAGHGGPAGHQHAASGPPPLESSESLDSGSSPTTPFHGGYGGSQYAGGRSMTASSTTAASNSSPALTHAPSPSLGGDTGKRARRRTEIAQKDVSMGVPVGGPPNLRRATLPASTADAAAALEAEAGTLPNGLPAAPTPEYAREHPTPPTGAPPMTRSYSSSGQGEGGNDSPGPMYHAAPGAGDAWSGHGHYPPHDVGHHGHHQTPYGHGMPAHPPMPMQTAVVQQGWGGDFGGRR